MNDVGEGPLPGKRRKKPDAGRVAKRVAPFAGRMAVRRGADGVQPLNAGFFVLEKMRAGATAKKRDKQKVKVRSG